VSNPLEAASVTVIHEFRKSQLEMQQVLTSSRASIILDQVDDDASSILLLDTSSSHLSENKALLDLDPMSHTEIDPKDFDFDQEVLRTPAYRKVKASKSKSSGTAPLSKEDYMISAINDSPSLEDHIAPSQTHLKMGNEAIELDQGGRQLTEDLDSSHQSHKLPEKPTLVKLNTAVFRIINTTSRIETHSKRPP
jgi:hypothetical protein